MDSLVIDRYSYFNMVAFSINQASALIVQTMMLDDVVSGAGNVAQNNEWIPFLHRSGHEPALPVSLARDNRLRVLCPEGLMNLRR